MSTPSIHFGTQMIGSKHICFHHDLNDSYHFEDPLRVAISQYAS